MEQPNRHIPAANRCLVPLIPMLSRRARRLTHSPAEADDLVQETLLKLCQRLRKADGIDDLPAYAMRTMSNQARKGWSTVQSEELREDDVTIEPDAEGRLAYAETMEAIARLPRPQRVLMELVASGETSPRQLADQTGLPLGTVMSRLARARARLRLDLETCETEAAD